MADTLTLTNPIIRGLACAALHPGLRAILLVDATPEQVLWCSALLAQMVAAVTGGGKPAQTTLSASESEDALWGLPFLPDAGGQLRLVWRGCIWGGRTPNTPQVVTIPTLARLSLAAERAAVLAVDAAVIHLERHGQHLHWQPQIWWVAGCAQSELGKVTPHLLDRFLIRLHVAAALDEDEVARTHHLLTQLAQPGDDASNPALPAGVAQALQQALHHDPDCAAAALDEVVRYVRVSEHYSLRRDLALARLAVAHAMLAGRDLVTPNDIDAAAVVMGLASRREAGATPKPEGNEPMPPVDDAQRERERSVTLPSPSPEGAGRTPGYTPAEPTPVFAPDATQTLSAAPLAAPAGTPWQEDQMPLEREAASLQLPVRHGGRSQTARGPVVGVEAASALHDLALVNTLFEACKHQVVRRQRSQASAEWLLLRPSDLRRYRRLPTPETYLVLVIDYTALRQCDWESALLPHLDWAYTTRAGVALIRVGAQQAVHELRADRLLGRSLLDPKIGAALLAAPGRATPLAHGLDLALQTLRHALQHGRSAAVEARVVVVSDGRGNIPLAASYAGQVTAPVNREGIEDALQVAAELSQLERTTLVCLDPQPTQFAELPKALAESLGVTAQPIPRREAEAPAVGSAGSMEVDA